MTLFTMTTFPYSMAYGFLFLEHTAYKWNAIELLAHADKRASWNTQENRWYESSLFIHFVCFV